MMENLLTTKNKIVLIPFPFDDLGKPVTVLDFLTFVIVGLHLFNRRERGGRRGFSNIEIAVFQII
jgi:hypothetical protein